MTIEPTTETWRGVKAHLDTEIEAVGLALEQRGMTALDTEFHRGRLAALRSVLALGVAPVSIDSASVDY